MGVRTVLIALGVLIIAVPSAWVAVIAHPYLGLTPHGPCSSKDVAAVRQIQDRYGLKRAYVARLVRTDFPPYDAEGTMERHVKNGLREVVLTHLRSDTYLAASFCNRTTAYDGPNAMVSIPKIEAALAPVDNTDSHHLLAVCASLEAVNLRRSPEEVRVRCQTYTQRWDRRRMARLARR